MSYYINAIKCYGSLGHDIKELIPQMNMRRRMSRAVKMGVTTALDSLLDGDAEGIVVDAIVSATSLGCIADSEKFLANIVEQDEQMLNPTPFIQSTFNTVGAQVALLRDMRCYNNTFSHRHTSFESALLDAMIQIDCGARAALVIYFDEATPTVERVFVRLGLLKGRSLGEGAYAFILTKERLQCSVAEVIELTFESRYSESISVNDGTDRYWSGAVAELFCQQREIGEYVISNDIDGVVHSQIVLRWL